jgi:hypothetical protein
MTKRAFVDAVDLPPSYPSPKRAYSEMISGLTGLVVIARDSQAIPRPARSRIASSLSFPATTILVRPEIIMF